jgi:phospholipid/cholesterol/gamma-HCH transport system substrate-binding protein
MAAPGSDERHLELKVGALILVALALLVTFILILGDWSLASKEQLDIYFQNPGGLTSGAPVKAAGRKVGTITEMSFIGQSGPTHPVTGRPSLVRTRIEIDEDVYAALRSDARFYITTKGVLGDPFLELDPGYDAQLLDTSQPVFGIDPPRLDLFLADAAALVDGLNHLLERNAKNLDQILRGGAQLASALGEMIDAGTAQGRFERIADGLDGLIQETRTLVVSARETYVDDPTVIRTLNNIESLSAKLNKEICPLTEDVRETMATLKRLGQTIGPEEQKNIKQALARLDKITVKADKSLTAVNLMVERLRRGEGTVGQLMTDEEIYDDLKELIRDIKRHPWKLIWED